MKIFSNLKLKSKNLGFTLIELLIVIAVIGGLASIVVTSFPAATKRARDATRRSDIKQYQTAMEVYYNKNSSYPASGGLQDISTGLCGSLSLPACPEDPKDPDQTYKVDSSAASYVIYAALEQPTSDTGFFVICSDGRAGECESAPSGSACPTGAGSCP